MTPETAESEHGETVKHSRTRETKKLEATKVLTGVVRPGKAGNEKVPDSSTNTCKLAPRVYVLS